MTDKPRYKRRPAVAQDIIDGLGQLPPVTVRAWVLEDDEGVAAIGGYFLAGRVAVAFSDMLRPLPAVVCWKQGKWIMQQAALPMICVATDSSGPFLERLGWEFIGESKDGDVYQCNF